MKELMDEQHLKGIGLQSNHLVSWGLFIWASPCPKAQMASSPWAERLQGAVVPGKEVNLARISGTDDQWRLRPQVLESGRAR